jgi:hypothetical protein
LNICFIYFICFIQSRENALNYSCRAWGHGEDVEWGQQIAARADVAPEENPFIAVQFLKPKSFSTTFNPAFVSWLQLTGNGVYIQPQRLAPEFWCNGTGTGSCGLD